jgi:excisionase family DNA binding protein
LLLAFLFVCEDWKIPTALPLMRSFSGKYQHKGAWNMNIDISQPTLLTIAQVAQELQLSKAKVYQLAYFEGLPTVSFGRAMRVRRQALQLWLEQREQKSA